MHPLIVALQPPMLEEADLPSDIRSYILHGGQGLSHETNIFKIFLITTC